MQRYDAVLKILLQKAFGTAFRSLAGVEIVQWLNVEMQQVSVGRADLVGLTAGSEIIHIELQASNDRDMALRMAEYGLEILRQYKVFPRQIVLYVGEKQLNMEAKLEVRDQLSYQYSLIDIRDMSTAELLAGNQIEGNLLAILTRLQDQTRVIREILERIITLSDAERSVALTQLLILSGLRRLGHAIQEEARKMPILNDILDHDLLGPLILQGRQEGLQEGLTEGLREGLREGMLKALRLMLEEHLGRIPEWAEQRLVNLSTDELTKAASRAHKAASYDDLFPLITSEGV